MKIYNSLHGHIIIPLYIKNRTQHLLSKSNNNRWYYEIFTDDYLEDDPREFINNILQGETTFDTLSPKARFSIIKVLFNGKRNEYL